MTQATKQRREPTPLNGVPTPNLFATINHVAEQPELAKFQWRATNTWQSGTHSVSTINAYSGAGGEQRRAQDFTYAADHTAVLCGEDRAPTPVEFLLHGLAGCLTAGIANIAAARGVKLDSVESTIEGDMDLRGILGLSDEVRNGFQGIRIHFKISGDAPAETLKKIVEQSRARSAVFCTLARPTPVEVTAEVIE